MLLDTAENAILIYATNVKSFIQNYIKIHHTFQIGKDIDELFTGFCQENEHQNRLYYLYFQY